MSCRWSAHCRVWRSLSPRSAATWSATGCARRWTYGCNGLALPMPDSLALDPRDRGGLQQPMLIARDLRKHFPVKGSGGKSVEAVDGVSFTVDKGETLGIVGESGCGKSTLARLLLHLVKPDAGELVYDGDAVGVPDGIAVGALRRQVQMVILDEPVSALDKSIVAQVLNLLRALKRQFNLTYVFISHDLNVVQYLSDRVLVMYLGRAVEIGPIEAIFERPLHPYTRALLASRPSMDPAQRIEEPPITGDPPNPIDPPSGCRFHTRCPFAEEVCKTTDPVLETWQGPQSHVAACHIHDPSSGHSLAGSA